MSRLAGKTVVITGAGRGIGAVMAKRMAQEGANVVVTDVLDTKGTVEAITEKWWLSDRHQRRCDIGR